MTIQEDFDYQIAHAHDNRSSSVLIITVAFAVVSTISTALRLWARRSVKARYAIDDAIILYTQVRHDVAWYREWS